MTKAQKMTGSRAEHREGGGTQRRGGNLGRLTTRGQQGPGCRLRAATGGANDERHDDRRRHAEWGINRLAEAGGGWVWATSRWTAFCSRKGVGERV